MIAALFVYIYWMVYRYMLSIDSRVGADNRQLQHDEFLASPGQVKDTSIGWHQDSEWTLPYLWVSPDTLSEHDWDISELIWRLYCFRVDVRGDGTYYADPSKVGTISVRLYAASDKHHVNSSVFLRRPIISRGSMIRRLSSYAGLAAGVRRQHPTRMVTGCVEGFEWLTVNESPYLEFIFQYFKCEHNLFTCLITLILYSLIRCFEVQVNAITNF